MKKWNLLGVAIALVVLGATSSDFFNLTEFALILIGGILAMAINQLVGNSRHGMCLIASCWILYWSAVAVRFIFLIEFSTCMLAHGQWSAFPLYAYSTALLLFGGLAVTNLFSIFFELIEKPQQLKS